MEKEKKEKLVKGIKNIAGGLATGMVFVGAILGLGACSKTQPVKEEPVTPIEDPKNNEDPVQLAKPTFNISSTGLITWAPTDKANGYKVYINGNSNPIELPKGTVSYQIPDLVNNTSYEVAIQALGDGESTLSSQTSTVQTFKYKTQLIVLETPNNLVANKNIITWDAVENASGYSIIVDNAPLFESNTNEWVHHFAEGSTHTISVLAKGDAQAYSSSKASNAITYTFSPAQIEAPKNIVVNKGKITWDAVENASAYQVFINSYQHAATTNTFEYKFNEGEDYTIEVASVGDGISYSAKVQKAPEIEYKLVLDQVNKPTNIVADRSGFITWTAVPNAAGYSVVINGKEQFTTQPRIDFDFEEGASYLLSIGAKGDGENYSKEYKYADNVNFSYTLPKLAAPTNLGASGPYLGLISWDAVPNATKYYVKINQNKPVEVTETSFSYKPKEYAENTVSVYAVGDGETYSAKGGETAETSYTFEPTMLSAPANITVSKRGTVSWDKVENAVGYQVIVDNAVGYLTFEESLDLQLVENQSYVISVRARGNGKEFAESHNELNTINYTHVIARETLATPTLAIEDNKFVWNAVENAKSYDIKLNNEDYNGEIITLPDGRKSIDIMALPIENQSLSIVAKAQTNSFDYKDGEPATSKFDVEEYITKAYNDLTGSSAKLLVIKNSGFTDESLGYYDNEYESGLTIVAFNELSIVYKHYVGETDKIGDIDNLLQNQEFNVAPADAELSTKSYGLHLLEFYTDKALDNDINQFATKILANPDAYDILCYTDTKASPGHYAPMQFGRYFVREKATGEITMFTIAIYITRNDGYPSLTLLRLDRNKLYQNGMDYFFDANRQSQTHRITEANSLKYFTMDDPEIIVGESMFENETEPSLSADVGASLSDGGDVENKTETKHTARKKYDAEELLKFAMSRLEAEKKASETAKHEAEPLTIEMPTDNNKSRSL